MSKFQVGEIWQDYSGNRFEILSIYRKNSDYPVIGLDVKSGMIVTYTAEGMSSRECHSPDDLMKRVNPEHPHAEFLRALADGVCIEVRDLTTNNSAWHPLNPNYGESIMEVINGALEWRIKE